MGALGDTTSGGDRGGGPRAPTYAIALLPFVLVVIVAVVAAVRERSASRAAQPDASVADAVAD